MLDKYNPIIFVHNIDLCAFDVMSLFLLFVNEFNASNKRRHAAWSATTTLF